jgi:hypothetical protein
MYFPHKAMISINLTHFPSRENHPRVLNSLADSHRREVPEPRKYYYSALKRLGKKS